MEASIASFRKAVTIEAGWFTYEKLLDGRVIAIAKSWSYEGATESEMEQLFADLIEGLCRHPELFNGMTKDQFLDGVNQFAGQGSF